jgi:hypothetical protein
MAKVRSGRGTARKDKRKSAPAKGSLLMVMRPVGEPKPGERVRYAAYYFDLGEREYSSIGFATVHWAFLEEAMFRRTVYFAKRAKVRVPKEAHDLSFSRRIRALRLLMSTTVKNPKRKRWWNLIISAIAKENGIRQKIVHGLWSYNPRQPDRLYSSLRPSLGKWMTPFNVDSLSEFGERVGELSFALLHPPSWGGRLPKDDGYYSYMSRSFLLRMSGKADALGFPQPTRVEQTPQQKASLEKFLEALNAKDHSGDSSS